MQPETTDILETPPAVSVLMPVFNAERYLAEATESILNQTFRDFEFIVINDGSTDAGPEMLEEYAARDPRVRLVSRENRGLVQTLNEGMDLARAPLIARMDADDVSLPERLEKQVAFMAEHPEVVACGTWAYWIDEDGDPISPGARFTTHEEIDGFHMKGQGGGLFHPTVMLRTASLRDINGYRQEILHAEDYDLFLRLAEVGRLACYPEILFHYRMQPMSVGHVHQAVQRESTRVAFVEACARRGVPVPESARAMPRPRVERNSARTWAWWALRAGNLRTARKHAWRALRRDPFSVESWRALYCALRGR